MQSRHRRRHRLTPIVDRRNEHVWSRALTTMGLQPLNSNTRPAASKGEEAAAPIHAPAPTAESSSTEGKKKTTTILDLPFETQKAIFQHSPPADLLCLSLVSKHFHNIAAEHLYRSFHIIFPNDEASDNSEYRSDALALGLETFTTSDYDYGKYVREFILEPTCGLEDSQDAYRDYLADTSCGKFLNNLLVLTLRKTKALETFKWDVRVEPSRQVYQTLHSLKALQHLHIRLHAGNSIYSTSQSIPAAIPPPPHNPTSFGPFSQTGQPAFTFPPPISAMPIGLPHPHPAPDAFGGTSSHQYPPSKGFGYKSKYKQLNARLSTTARPPPTLSGFKNLKSLAVLDMDSLDYISEINKCIVGSWTTLTSLKLSFSEVLSTKSKKPQPELHSDDDSDPDDDFTQLVPAGPGGGPPPPAPLSGPSDAPTKAIKAQEEKKKQELVLARIFGIKVTAREPSPPPAPELAKKLAEDPRRALVMNLTPLGNLLLKMINHEGDESEIGKAALSVVTRASQAYLDSLDEEKQAQDKASGEGKAACEGKASDKENASTGEKSGDSPQETTNEPSATPAAAPDPPSQDSSKSIETETPERGLFDEPDKKKKPRGKPDSEIANPDDIDIEAPEPSDHASDGTPEEPDQDVDEAAQTGDAAPASEEKTLKVADKSSEPENEPKTTDSEFYKIYVLNKERLQKALENVLTQRDSIEVTDAADRLKRENLLKAADAYMSDLIQLEMQFKDSLSASQTHQGPSGGAEKISDYVRQTRGLNLETLSIYLIPIKAGVLMKAINIQVLRSITLLEVGHQNLFWATAAKHNAISPLPLRKIYTDNVTLHFLAFVHNLECVEDLLMVERKPPASVESLTTKTSVTMDQIRRTVLRKHVGTLKVLMIQNDDTSDWDLNTESAVLLCKRAKNLEELAVSFGTRTMHSLLQLMPGLVNLRALHTIDFRHDDTCVWLMHEFRGFAVDAISHNPHMKLEYLALGPAVERLVRHIPKKVDKGKAKVKSNNTVSNKNLMDMLPGHPESESAMALLKMGVFGNVPGSKAESDDEELHAHGKNGLVVETIEGIEFSDIPGVRIFEKDVLYGRL